MLKWLLLSFAAFLLVGVFWLAQLSQLDPGPAAGVLGLVACLLGGLTLWLYWVSRASEPDRLTTRRKAFTVSAIIGGLAIVAGLFALIPPFLAPAGAGNFSLTMTSFVTSESGESQMSPSGTVFVETTNSGSTMYVIARSSSPGSPFDVAVVFDDGSSVNCHSYSPKQWRATSDGYKVFTPCDTAIRASRIQDVASVTLTER